MGPEVPWGELALLVGALLVAGFVTGLLAGLLGIGGGGILLPALFELFGALGVDDAARMHLAVGTSLAVIVPTSIRSFLAHRARGAVDLDLVRSMALPVVIGVGLGGLLARYTSDDVLKLVWVGAATLIALKLAFGRDWRLGEQVPGQPFRTLYGGFVGLVSTLMSIGGGVFISAMMTLYGQPIQRAVATASGFGPLIAIPGALAFVWAGCLRVALLQQLTWAVNSFGHVYGAKLEGATSEGRDHLGFALLLFGEGLHSFHHRFPSAAVNEPARLDLHGALLVLLERAGLVWRLRRYPPARVREARRRAS